jgi:hypothetical protein
VCLIELVQLKNAMTSSGIELATFRLVASCLSQLHYHVPQHIVHLYISCAHGNNCNWFTKFKGEENRECGVNVVKVDNCISCKASVEVRLVPEGRIT